MMKNENYVLITGASTGLGKAFAHECAGKNRNLILTALPGENIGQIAGEIRNRYNVKVQTFETDLTVNGEVEKFAAWVNSDFSVDVLINNAGIGGTIPFADAPLSYIDQIVLLNMRALVLLTHLMLPNLKERNKAYILNIASMASFGPMPYKTVYPASKAFVYSFSRGLYAELKGTGIFVSVAHPGAMATNPDVTERIKQHSGLIRATMLSPEKVAKICFRQLYRNDSLILPGFMSYMSWLVLKLCPIWLRLIIMKSNLKKEVNLKRRPRAAAII